MVSLKSFKGILSVKGSDLMMNGNIIIFLTVALSELEISTASEDEIFPHEPTKFLLSPAYDNRYETLTGRDVSSEGTSYQSIFNDVKVIPDKLSKDMPFLPLTGQNPDVSLQTSLRSIALFPGNRSRKFLRPYVKDESYYSLSHLLQALVEEEFKGCDLIIALDRSFLHSHFLGWIYTLENIKQVLLLQYPVNFEGLVKWQSSHCLAVMIFLSDSSLLITFGSLYMDEWNSNARVVVTGLEKEQFQEFIQTRKAKKTEHILGVLKGERKGHFHIYMNELYWGRRDITQVGYWRGNSFTRRQNLFPDKVSNLRGVTLVVTNFEFPPAVIYHRSPDGVVTHEYGLDVAIVEALAHVFNFTLVLMKLPRGEMWGDRFENGSWNGIVGALGSGNADLGIANIFITALQGRREFQEFSAPYRDEVSCFFTLIGQPLPRWQNPILPFQPSLWALFFVGLLLTGPVLSLLSRASATIGHEDYRFQSLQSAMMYTYGIHFANPMPKLPQRMSTQVFVAFLWLYVITIIIAYSSNLTAFLTVSRVPASIETFRDLYESNLQVVGQGLFFKYSMAQSENPYLKALSERFTGIESSLDDGKDEVLKGKAALIESRSALEFYLAQMTLSSGPPKLRIMRECYSPYSIGIAYQSNSPLKRKFDMAITWMFESGLVRRWFLDTISLYQKYQREQGGPNEGSSNAEEQPYSGVIPLGIDHMEGIFVIYIFGCLLSVILFVIEIFLHKIL